jgi:hypothetical protein
MDSPGVPWGQAMLSPGKPSSPLRTIGPTNKVPRAVHHERGHDDVLKNDIRSPGDSSFVCGDVVGGDMPGLHLQKR